MRMREGYGEGDRAMAVRWWLGIGCGGVRVRGLGLA